VLHARVAPVVGRLVWSFLGVDPDRDDLVHDIFVRILRSAHTVQDQSKLDGWAARVTVNAIKNEFRRRKLRRFLSLDTRESELAGSVHPDFEGRELLRRTTRILEAMPVNERIPFTLQLLDNRPVEEIAQLCDASERTIKRRLRAAKERFSRLAQNDPLLRSRIAEGTQGEET
jgi:RNA polymerase sigma-70 factor (ECF subfamily)